MMDDAMAVFARAVMPFILIAAESASEVEQMHGNKFVRACYVHGCLKKGLSNLSIIVV